jgi:hypothetical protein
MHAYRASKLCLGLVAGLALGLATGGFAEDGVPTPVAKIDSGLGELSPYSQRQADQQYATPAAKVDSGLGELPHYSEWHEPWLKGHPAEKVRGGVDEAAPSKNPAPAHAARTTR